MQRNHPSTTLDALRHALSEPVRKHRFIDSQRERWGWTCSYRQAQSLVNHWLDGAHSNRFPVEALDDAVRVIGDAAFLDPLLAIESKEIRRRRSGPVKVQPRSRDRG